MIEIGGNSVAKSIQVGGNLAKNVVLRTVYPDTQNLDVGQWPNVTFEGVPPSFEQRVADLEYLEIEAGEDIVSYKPIAFMDSKAFIYDAANIEHLYAFAGFSITGALIGENVRVQNTKYVEFVGWSFTPDSHYLAGENGALVEQAIGNEVFRNIIAYAVSPTKIKVITDNDSVIINN